MSIPRNNPIQSVNYNPYISKFSVILHVSYNKVWICLVDVIFIFFPILSGIVQTQMTLFCRWMLNSSGHIETFLVCLVLSLAFISYISISGTLMKKINLSHTDIHYLVMSVKRLRRIGNFSEPFLYGESDLEESEIRDFWSYATTHLVPKHLLGDKNIEWSYY